MNCKKGFRVLLMIDKILVVIMKLQTVVSRLCYCFDFRFGLQVASKLASVAGPAVTVRWK